MRPNAAPQLRGPLTRRHFLRAAALAALAAKLPAQPPPRRIVSTAPSITESLFALDLGDRVVGVSRYCDYPPAVRKLPRVGTYLQPDAEAIARLAPDLVVLELLATELAGRLAALHIPIVKVPEGSLQDIYTGVDIIATAAAVPQRGEALIGRIQRDLAAIHAKAALLPSPRVLMVVGHRTGMLAEIYAVGPGNYLQQLIQVAGGANVLAKPGLPIYPHIALETVLRDDPDVIIDASNHEGSEAQRQAAGLQVVALWKQESQLSAARTNRIFAGSSNALVVPGPRAPEAAQLLFDYIHAPAARP